MSETANEKSPKPLIPLWALVIGPFWIPIFFILYFLLALLFLVWVMPTAIACELFGWQMPSRAIPKCFRNTY